MSIPRIILLASSAGGYGGENALLTTVRLQRRSLKPYVVVPETGPLVDALKTESIPVEILPFAILDRRYFHPLRILLYLVFAAVTFFRFVSLFRRLRPEAVHTNNVLIIPGALAAWMLRIPHVWHIREVIETHHLHPSLWKIWRWIILTFSDKVICISKAVSEQFGESNKVVIVHDGVDIDLFRPATKRASPPQKEKPIKFGIVGRLEHRRKGQDLFIEAANIALRKKPDLEFNIVGHEREGMEQEEQKLHDLVASYGREKNIRFRGFVPPEQMPSVMNELDVLVLCSKQPEGLAIVLLEAMASGKSVISFAEGGPLDILEDNVNGLLVPPGNVQKLADAMLRLASDEELRMRLGESGRKTVEERFRSEISARKIEGVYRLVMRERMWWEK